MSFLTCVCMRFERLGQVRNLMHHAQHVLRLPAYRIGFLFAPLHRPMLAHRNDIVEMYFVETQYFASPRHALPACLFDKDAKYCVSTSITRQTQLSPSQSSSSFLLCPIARQYQKHAGRICRLPASLVAAIIRRLV
jgi:hypothetical protein